MIHIPKEGTFVVLIVNRPKRSLRSLFVVIHFFFATSPVRNHCNNRSFARSDFQLPRKRVPKRTNKPIKNAVAIATLGGHGQVSDPFIL